jgi:thiamine pyrophosphokinase
VKKDLTDLELALQYAQSLGAEDILMLGALGNRWDQTLANLLLPAAAAYTNLRIRLLDGNQEMTLVRAGQTLELAGHPGEILSLIPLAGDAGEITTHGLEYPLNRETLPFGSTRGVSNVLQGDFASVRLETGMLLCILIHAGHMK